MKSKYFITIFIICLLSFSLYWYFDLRIKSHIISIKGEQPNILNDLYSSKFKKRFTLNGNKSKLNGVDMVYCIVMPQRKQYATDQINKLNVMCKYFDAVKPADLSNELYF